jgi:hypothetical protein
MFQLVMIRDNISSLHDISQIVLTLYTDPFSIPLKR